MNAGLLLRGHIFAYLIRVLRLSTRPQLCVPHPQPRVHTFIFPYFCISVFPHRRTSHFCAPVVRVLLLPHSRARVLAPMRPAPGPGLLPRTRAPGPGPFPCSHAPGARSRPGPLHPCAQRPRPRRLSSLQAGPYRRETVRKARKKAGRQTVRLFTRGCAPSVLYAKSQACASTSLRP